MGKLLCQCYQAAAAAFYKTGSYTLPPDKGWGDVLCLDVVCLLGTEVQSLLEGSDVESAPLPPIEEEHNELDSDIDLDAMD